MTKFRQILDHALNSLPTELTQGSSGARQPGSKSGSRFGGIEEAARRYTRDPKSLATGAAAGGLLGMLLGGGRGRRTVRNVAAVGGLALVGGLAYRAYRDWQANQGGTESPAPRSPARIAGGAGTGTRWSAGGQVAGAAVPPPPPAADWGAPAGSDFNPSDETAAERLAGNLVRAMVAAAKADGHVTSSERRRIAGEMGALGLGDEAEAMIAEELDTSLDACRIAALAANEAEAAELYAASLLVVDPEAPAERAYLAELASAMRLDPGLVARLHDEAAALGG